MSVIQDEETGEVLSKSLAVDFETGEQTQNYVLQNNHVAPTRTFHVPKEYLKSDNKDKKHEHEVHESFPMCDREKFYALNEDIILGQNTMSYRLLLILPVLFICPKLPALLIAIFETIVHIWCHKKNKHKSDPGLYYRSPLHIVTSEYCAYCRNQKHMIKIGKMQDERKYRHFKSTYNCVTT